MANTIGQVLSSSLFPTHPVFGARKDLTVTEVSPVTGRWTLGEITCDCGSVRSIHPGDHFQVTQCVECKDAERKAKKALARATSPESAEKKAARDAKKAERQEKLAERKLAQATERAAKQEAKLIAAKAKLAEKAALLAKVAAEHGVAVSEDAVLAG